jgi:hypothetical protein
MAAQPFLRIFAGPWVAVRDGDDTARSLFDRHYSRYYYKDGRKPALFVGPGEKLVLLTPCARALFVWRKFLSADGQSGVNCVVFRNEGAGLSSALILAAERVAWQRWPGERLYTYVNPVAVASSNPGWCFMAAGWQRCGTTKKRRYRIFEKTCTSPLH